MLSGARGSRFSGVLVAISTVVALNIAHELPLGHGRGTKQKSECTYLVATIKSLCIN